MRKIIIPIAVSFLFSLQSCKKNNAIHIVNLEEKVNIDNNWTYLEELQKIAQNNNNNRSVGSPGGVASAEYIAKV